MNWIVILVLALALALLVAAAGWWVAWRNHDVIEDVSAEKQKEIDALVVERNDARSQRDRLNVENAMLTKQGDGIAARLLQILSENADLREALQEEKAKVKALHMQTVEIEEVKPPRGGRGKKAG